MNETARQQLHINTANIDSLATVSSRKKLTDAEQLRKQAIFEAYDKRPSTVARRERMLKHYIKKLREENN